MDFIGEMDTEALKKVAIVCHEANRAYCRTIGDESQPSWKEAPDWQKDSAIDGVRKIRESIYNPLEYHGPKESHNAWLEKKMLDGWRYGKVKDPELKTHPCFLPWKLLPEEQKRKDFLFLAIAKVLLETPTSQPSRDTF